MRLGYEYSNYWITVVDLSRHLHTFPPRPYGVGFLCK